MIQFLKTRSYLQWLAFIAWAIIIGFIAKVDWMQEKQLLSIIETLIYSLIFIGGAYMGYRDSKR